jgi:ApaG protein
VTSDCSATLLTHLWPCYHTDVKQSPFPAELAPVSDAVTNSIRVEVLSRHSPEHSRPTEGEWVFQYTVRITNQGTDTVQLISRHWIITDATGEVQEVKGPGVVGQQPMLRPGESFKYSSWCPLKTPIGMMYGAYQMVASNGGQFEIEIAPFALRAPQKVH